MTRSFFALAQRMSKPWAGQKRRARGNGGGDGGPKRAKGSDGGPVSSEKRGGGYGGGGYGGGYGAGSGKGIAAVMVTCDGGKEQSAAREMIAWLNEVSGASLAPLTLTRASRASNR